VACGLLGVYQPGNALLAAAAARELGADERAIRAGLRGARWPGRFQIFRRDPLVILDGAHNPAGARARAASLRAYFPGRPVTFVIGVLADKDAGGILAALRPLAARVILTASANPRAAPPDALRALLPAGARVDTARSPQDALTMAIAEDPRGIVCVAGSLSLIGDVLAAAADDGQDVLFTAGARC
jgi:dihydrofolate synthase/folylpolyglutamate synthase